VFVVNNRSQLILNSYQDQPLSIFDPQGLVSFSLRGGAPSRFYASVPLSFLTSLGAPSFTDGFWSGVSEPAPSTAPNQLVLFQTMPLWSASSLAAATNGQPTGQPIGLILLGSVQSTKLGMHERLLDSLGSRLGLGIAAYSALYLKDQQSWLLSSAVQVSEKVQVGQQLPAATMVSYLSADLTTPLQMESTEIGGEKFNLAMVGLIGSSSRSFESPSYRPTPAAVFQPLVGVHVVGVGASYGEEHLAAHSRVVVGVLVAYMMLFLLRLALGVASFKFARARMASYLTRFSSVSLSAFDRIHEVGKYAPGAEEDEPELIVTTTTVHTHTLRTQTLAPAPLPEAVRVWQMCAYDSPCTPPPLRLYKPPPLFPRASSFTDLPRAALPKKRAQLRRSFSHTEMKNTMEKIRKRLKGIASSENFQASNGGGAKRRGSFGSQIGESMLRRDHPPGPLIMPADSPVSPTPLPEYVSLAHTSMQHHRIRAQQPPTQFTPSNKQDSVAGLPPPHPPPSFGKATSSSVSSAVASAVQALPPHLLLQGLHPLVLPAQGAVGPNVAGLVSPSSVYTGSLLVSGHLLIPSSLDQDDLSSPSASLDAMASLGMDEYDALGSGYATADKLPVVLSPLSAEHPESGAAESSGSGSGSTAGGGRLHEHRSISGDESISQAPSLHAHRSFEYSVHQQSSQHSIDRIDSDPRIEPSTHQLAAIPSATAAMMQSTDVTQPPKS
jgi:hypothetical protein